MMHIVKQKAVQYMSNSLCGHLAAIMVYTYCLMLNYHLVRR